jgi:hypothetical protein
MNNTEDIVDRPVGTRKRKKEKKKKRKTDIDIRALAGFGGNFPSASEIASKNSDFAERQLALGVPLRESKGEKHARKGRHYWGKVQSAKWLSDMDSNHE